MRGPGDALDSRPVGGCGPMGSTWAKALHAWASSIWTAPRMRLAKLTRPGSSGDERTPFFDRFRAFERRPAPPTTSTPHAGSPRALSPGRTSGSGRACSRDQDRRPSALIPCGNVKPGACFLQVGDDGHSRCAIPPVPRTLPAVGGDQGASPGVLETRPASVRGSGHRSCRPTGGSRFCMKTPTDPGIAAVRLPAHPLQAL